MLKKDNSRGSKLILDEFKSSFNRKESKDLRDKPVMLPNTEQINKLFILKKNKSPIKTISYINNDSGKMRHFTPAAQE
jgi:hypothetical protein